MTPSLPSDDFTDDAEGELRKRVLKGLRLALDEKFSSGSDTDRRDLTKTEEEKLLYFAICEYDLPLTYSWYLAGAKTKSNAGTSAQTASAASPDWNSSSEPSIEDTRPDQTDIDPETERYREYYLNEVFFDDYNIKKLVYTKKDKFLCDFYNSCAGEKYTELYVHSTRLRNKLEGIEELIDATDKETTLSDWGGGSEDGVLSRHEEKKFRRLVSKIHLDLARMDGFKEVRMPLREATDEIEIILTKLTHLSSLTPEQREIVDELDEFFYDYVWKYPALKISAETATGPNADELSQKRKKKFSRFHNTIKHQTEMLREKRVEAGFRPSAEEFTANEDSEAVESIHKMTRDSLEDKL